MKRRKTRLWSRAILYGMSFGTGFWLGLMLCLLAACNSKAPVATGYKTQLEEGKGSAGGDLVARGTALWNTKCLGCHGAVATTDKRTALTTKESVLGAKAGQPAHDAVAWPNDNEATALVKALNP